MNEEEIMREEDSRDGALHSVEMDNVSAEREQRDRDNENNY